MVDELFFRRPEERAEDWHARLAAMRPTELSCHLRERRKVWLDMAQQALRKERRTKRRASRRQQGAGTSAVSSAGPQPPSGSAVDRKVRS